LHGSTKVITAISASFSRASWSETRVERERSAHEFPGAIRHPDGRKPATHLAKQIDDLGPAILLRTYALRTKKADARAAAVIGAMSKGVLG
jgi:hypothetical protein